MRPIDYFDRAAEAHPEHPALIGGGVSFTYSEARARTEGIARGLYGAGFEFGEAVAVLAPNDVGAMLCVLGAIRAGGPWVPVNVRNAVSTNAAYMTYVRTRWLFYHSSVAPMVAEIRSQVPELKGVICIDAQDGDTPSLATFIARAEDTDIPDWNDPFGRPDHPISLWPTGGTTGPSKGVIMSNRSFGTLIEMGLRYFDIGEPPVHLAVAPITHAAGAMIIVLAGLSATSVILPGFDALEVLKAIDKYRVTHLFLPPTAYYAMLDHPQVGDFDYSSLRQMLIAAAPVSPDKFQAGIDVFGPCICQSFGQAESPMIVSWLPPEVVVAAVKGDHPERLKSCGAPTSACQVAILDDDGNHLPPGERGEICVRGPLVTPGYFERPEATAEARTFGWHHTGDIGYQDQDKYLYIVDRKKDMIITGGFNVFAAEVEAPILALPEITECAVIGIPDEKWGEAIKAICVLKAGETLSPDDVLSYCKQKLGGVKAPKSVEFWDAIPKTPIGKTDKKEIRAKYWTDKDRGVH